MLCVLCEDKSGGLYPLALSLAGSVVLCDRIVDVDNDPGLLPLLVPLLSGCWSCPTFVVAAAEGGPHAGVRAVGVGCSWQARRRAAHLALAATVQAHLDPAGMIDPSGDGAFAVLAGRARQLFDGCITGASGDASAATAPWRGLAHSAASTPALGPPPPPPPPPLAAVWAPPAELGTDLDIEADSQGSSVATPTSTHAQELMEVSAMAEYDAEGPGYLSLRPGDRLQLNSPEPEPGAPTDGFRSYLYGRRFGGAGARASEQGEGWFPYELVVADLI